MKVEIFVECKDYVEFIVEKLCCLVFWQEVGLYVWYGLEGWYGKNGCCVVFEKWYGCQCGECVDFDFEMGCFNGECLQFFVEGKLGMEFLNVVFIDCCGIGFGMFGFVGVGGFC